MWPFGDRADASPADLEKALDGLANGDWKQRKALAGNPTAPSPAKQQASNAAGQRPQPAPQKAAKPEHSTTPDKPKSNPIEAHIGPYTTKKGIEGTLATFGVLSTFCQHGDTDKRTRIIASLNLIRTLPYADMAALMAKIGRVDGAHPKSLKRKAKPSNACVWPYTTKRGDEGTLASFRPLSAFCKYGDTDKRSRIIASLNLIRTMPHEDMARLMAKIGRVDGTSPTSGKSNGETAERAIAGKTFSGNGVTVVAGEPYGSPPERKYVPLYVDGKYVGSLRAAMARTVALMLRDHSGDEFVKACEAL
jgi:hypothetical protein